MQEQQSELAEGRQQGRVIKAYNSFFYVQTGGDLIACKLRGKFRKTRKSVGVVPGDQVIISRLDDGSGVVEEVFFELQQGAGECGGEMGDHGNLAEIGRAHV